MKKHPKDTRRSITENGITVTMLDDVNTKHNATTPHVYIPPRDVNQEGYVEGFYLPNRFRVEGAGFVAELEVQSFTRNGVRQFGCVSIKLFPQKGSDEIVAVDRLPVATWLRLAVRCSRQLCRYYPANYLGAMLDHNGKPITVEGGLSGVRITKLFGTEEPAVIPLKRLPSQGYQWTDDAVRKLLGQQPRRRRNSMTLDRLQEVADVYNAATTYPLKAVMKSFGMARTTADKWVRKCKDLELITDETKQGANK